MLRKIAATAVAVLVLLLSATPTAFGEPPPPGNGVSCPNRHCGVGAVDPGSAGSPGAGAPVGPPRAMDATDQPVSDSGGAEGSGSPGSSDGGVPAVTAPACTEEPMNPQPAAGSPWWEGKTAADGVVVQWACTGGLTPATCTSCTVLTPHFAAGGAPAPGGPGGAPAPAAPPPPTPEELAQQAYQQLPIPEPSMHFGPDDSKIAAKYWLYMWVDDPGAVSATATAGAVSVTATARLTSVTWSMGEPAAADGPSTAAGADHLSGAWVRIRARRWTPLLTRRRGPARTCTGFGPPRNAPVGQGRGRSRRQPTGRSAGRRTPVRRERCPRRRRCRQFRSGSGRGARCSSRTVRQFPAVERPINGVGPTYCRITGNRWCGLVGQNPADGSGRML